ncbi:MAG: hypothetical protein CG440_75, partial [Methanosaeta sp. NSM2]
MSTGSGKAWFFFDLDFGFFALYRNKQIGSQDSTAWLA